MRLKIPSCLVLALLFAIGSLAHAMPSKDYLPPDAELDASVPSPESVLGWEPGEWRIHHDALVRYMYTLAEHSDRVSIKVTGYTHEQRPLLQLVFTSPRNQARLESLRTQHLEASRTGDTAGPLVVWLGYSVHGNEASGSNAAPVVAWYLAASQSEFVTELLDSSIVILDPSLNPDGLQRFAAWSNANRSLHPVSDANARIHNEDWPQGRTNHYLFDLNRDWLPLVQPESQARITEYHRWLPHLLTDHHETRHDGFFYQPGVPTRQHPLTTDENLQMTRSLATYHASSLDQAGVMNFSEDTYDDFYYGKGSTYPDINGSIGILFEQPRVDGPIRDRESVTITFQQAIHNQVRMSLSSLQGAWELRDEMKAYQAGFFQAMQRRASRAGFDAWVVGDGGDPGRAQEMLALFKRHQVEFRALAENLTVDGQAFQPGHAWVIPAKQRQFGLIQAMVETRTEFEDNVFYDVSAWSLPLAYNLPFARLSRMPDTTVPPTPGQMALPDPSAVAWIVEWRQLDAPRVLQSLLDAGATVRAATKPFSMASGSQANAYSEGGLAILRGIQKPEVVDKIVAVLTAAATRGVRVDSYSSHVAVSGPGLGTSQFKPVPKTRPLLVAGPGTYSYDVGEVWHQMDQRLGAAPVMVDMYRLRNIRLHDYTHLLMAGGNYNAIGSGLKNRITDWIDDGGILVATENASEFAESLCFSESGCDKGQAQDEAKKPVEQTSTYADFQQRKARRTIAGAIVSTRVDNTHPVAWGYERDLPLFRSGSLILKESDNPFASPVRYTGEPLMSGYIGEERLQEMSNQAAVIAERHGKGAVVRFADNPLFRGFWQGTARLWVNALYFAPLLESTELPE